MMGKSCRKLFYFTPKYGAIVVSTVTAGLNRLA